MDNEENVATGSTGQTTSFNCHQAELGPSLHSPDAPDRPDHIWRVGAPSRWPAPPRSVVRPVQLTTDQD